MRSRLHGAVLSSVLLAGALVPFAAQAAAVVSLRVTGLPPTIVAGTWVTFTVAAVDATGAAAPRYVGAVSFASSASTTTLPSGYAFTLADGGAHEFSLMTTRAGPLVLSVVDVDDLSISGSASTTCIADVPARLSVTRLASSVQRGVATSFDVSAFDTFGNPASEHVGPVIVTSSDPHALTPPVQLLSAGTATGLWITFNTAGTQSLKVTDTSLENLFTSATTSVSTPLTATITAPAVLNSGARATATVPSQRGVRYQWSVTNGTITAGAGTRQVTFLAGVPGSLNLTCRVTRTATRASATSVRTLLIAALPRAQVITAPTFVTAAATGRQASVPAAAAMTYAWAITGGAITSAATGITSGGRNTVTFTAGAVGTLTLTAVEINLAGLRSARGTATVRVVAAPETPTGINTVSPVTAGSTGLSASITAHAATTSWWTIAGGAFTNPHGASGETSGGVNTITFAAGPEGTLTLTAREINLGGAQSAVLSRRVTVKAPPVSPSITAPSPVTAGQSGRTASVVARTGFTYAWTLDDGTITSAGGPTGVTSGGTNSIVYTAGAPGLVSVGCAERNGVVGPTGVSAPAAASVVVTAAATPWTPIIVAPGPVSEGQRGRTASVTSLAGMTYLWTITNGIITSAGGSAGDTAGGRNTLTYTAGAVGTVDVTCVEQSGPLSSLPATKSVVVVPAPMAPSIATFNLVHEGDPSTASVSARADMRYQWSVSNGTVTGVGGSAGLTSHGTNVVDFTAGTRGTVGLSCVEVNAAGVESMAATASVQVAAAAPSTLVISTPPVVTAGQGSTASVPARPSMSYLWSLTDGTIVDGGSAAGVTSGGANTLSFRAGTPGTLVLSCVEINADGLSAPPATAQVSVSPASQGGIGAMPRLGLGRPIVGTNTPTLLNDGRYRASYAWTAPSGAWAALDLGVGPTQLLVQISDEDSWPGDLNGGGMPAWRWLTSADSTNGADGTWTQAVAVTGNVYIYRSHTIPFSGQRWLKLVLDAASTIDEIDVWDASLGVTDTWMFLGDSITNRATKRGTQSGVGHQPSFQADILATEGRYPMQIGGGHVSWGAADLRNQIDTLIVDFPLAKYWALSIGTNDAAAGAAALPQWLSNVQYVIDRLEAANRVPMLARIPWTSDPSYGAPSNTALFNTSGVDVLTAQNHLQPGPDLYGWFLAHPGEMDDGVHPSDVGCLSWNRLWAEAALPLYRPTTTQPAP